jgi:hypothetical protein
MTSPPLKSPPLKSPPLKSPPLKSPPLGRRIAAGVALLLIAMQFLPSTEELHLAVELKGDLQLSNTPGYHEEVVVAIDSIGHRWVTRTEMNGSWSLRGWRPTFPIHLFACELATRPGRLIDGPQAIQRPPGRHGQIVFGAENSAAICRELAT